MAELTGSPQVFHANTNTVDTTQQIAVGTRGFDPSGNEYIYAQGVASTVAGNWVVFNEDFATTRLTANEVGPVGIAMAAINATSSYGWYQIFGVNTTATTDTIAADKSLYIDGTAGRVDDAGVAGDIVLNAYSMTADTSNVATVFIAYPSVTDDLGGSSGTVGGSDTEVNYNDAGTLAGDPDFTFNKSTGTITVVGIRVGTASVIPVSNDGAALGSSTVSFSDLFLASGALINFNDGDVTLTHAANTLTFGGATSGYQFDALVAPSADDGAALGNATTLRWSDLFLANQAVINFNNGDVTLTHDTNSVTFAGGTVNTGSLTAIGLITTAGLTVGSEGTINIGLVPDANDGAYLGTSALSFSDLFLASEAVINFAAGDATITHSTNTITVGGATLSTGSLTVVGRTTLDTGLTGLLRADSGIVATDSDIMDLVTLATTGTAGRIEIATAAEITTGTSQILAMTPGLFSQSDMGKRVVELKVDSDSTAITSGSGRAVFWVPTQLDGYNLVDAEAFVTGTASTAALTIHIRKVASLAAVNASGTAMFTTLITIDANEFDSTTAATAPVISQAGTDRTVSVSNRIAVDVPPGSGTATGLGVVLVFQAP